MAKLLILSMLFLGGGAGCDDEESEECKKYDSSDCISVGKGSLVSRGTSCPSTDNMDCNKTGFVFARTIKRHWVEVEGTERGRPRTYQMLQCAYIECCRECD